MLYSYVFHATLILFCSLQTTITTDCSTLKQVHLVFRHGERSPAMEYPNDPYKSIWPDGLGYLTKKGKVEMYNLGVRLRRNYYSCFLSEYFNPNEVKVLSSYSDRCLMSAELYNAGFFIPTNDQIWNPEILWQPIPISYKPREEDNLIAAKKKCRKYDDTYDELFSTTKYIKILKDNEKLFEYLTNNTGMKIDTIRKVEELYNTLEIEQLQNLTLPEWTQNETIYPIKMKEIASICLASFTETDFMKRMKGGPFVKKVLGDMEQILSTENYPKFFIYSGHDITLINILRTLGIYDILKPSFAAYLKIELHQVDSSPEVKFYYADCGWCDEQELKVKNLENICMLKDLEEQLKPIIPEDWEKECE